MGVCRGIPIFLIFDQKTETEGILVLTYVPTFHVLSKIMKATSKFSDESFRFLQLKKISVYCKGKFL